MSETLTGTLRFSRLRPLIADLGSVGVAFSGGTDSTLLLALCRNVLGPERVLALTVLSELTPTAERERAARVARALGVRHVEIPFPALAHPEIAANRPDRCYHCKRAMFGRLLEIVRAEGFSTLVHGANVDDLGDYRPGLRAAEELGVRAPLLEAGLTKAEIRELSRRLGLPTADLPPMACLASRIPYGTPLTPEALARVDAAEDYLRREWGLRQVRVRDHFPLARLEVPEDDIPRLAAPPARQEVARRLRELGYRYVTLDLEGFRSGSLNPAEHEIRNTE